MLTLVPQSDLVQCSGCPARVQEVLVGERGWDALFGAGTWRFTCPACQAADRCAPGRAMSAGKLIAATYRPAANEIALFVEDGGAHASVPLSIADATAIRDAIDGALAIAACVADPISAVPGEYRG
jgi:hypothetical protein